MEQIMAGRITTDNVQLDATTSRAVARGIGEKLRQSINTDQRFPDRLQKLLDEMQTREAREVPGDKRR
jgi:hypothetical protein